MRILLLAGLLLATPALAQGSRSPWGGPDSPGGFFGGFGDSGTFDNDRDGRVTHDEVWTWLRGRFQEADRNRDGRLARDEIGARMHASPAFRAADTNEDDHLSEEELRALSQAWFRARDRNRDRALTGAEMPRRRAAAAQPR